MTFCTVKYGKHIIQLASQALTAEFGKADIIRRDGANKAFFEALLPIRIRRI
jgi:hypothetical protein